MWIMLTKKLPTIVSPPKMSLFYSYKHVPDLDDEKRMIKSYLTGLHGIYSNEDIERTEKSKKYRKKIIGEIKNKPWVCDLFGKCPNELGAVWIFYKNEKIKVWPHEYSIVTKDNFKLYITESHELVPGDEVKEQFAEMKLSKNSRSAYDAALVDGCDHYEATMVALGKDPSEMPPPLGWYRCKKQYAQVYCHDSEMEE